MANISLYISGQTELDDISEFFQKRLIGEGETPIAFFDGVFYESHQERVGNIVYQDYLIYTDKALYLWARGASKDFLDRFSLGTVSVNSRNKDSAFATMNLKIRREGKEPIFVIFDMVEIREADMIVKLQTVVESIIEDYLGINYRQEIPQDTADRIFQAARSVCPPRQIALKLDTPQAPVPDAGIGYGQDLLEQFRATGSGQQQAPYPPYQPPGTAPGPRPRSTMGPQDAMRGLESMLPTDPAALKRIAEQIKNMVGDAPFKMRDQVMKDLQHVPGDMATVLTALNELLSNIAGNPLAERFIMNAIKTAVVNDGVLGSLGKIIKMTGIGSGGGKKSPKPQGHEPSREERGASSARKSPFVEEQDEDSSTIRRKKISIKDDDDHSGADLFAGSDEPIISRQNRPPVSRSSEPDNDDSGAGSGGRRKKLSIKMEDDNEIARKLMSYDESEREAVPPAPVKAPVAVSSVASTENGFGIRRKKLAIKAEEGSGAKADIAQKLMSYDEASRGAVNSLLSSDEVQGIAADEVQPEPEPERPVRKKIQIRAEDEPEIESDPEPESELLVRKKIQIKAEVEPEPMVAFEPEIESVLGAEAEAAILAEPEIDIEPEPEPEKLVRKKIQIKAEADPEPETAAASEPEIESGPDAEMEDLIAGSVAIEVTVESELEVLLESEPESSAIEEIRNASELEEAFDIPEEVIFSALAEPEKAEDSGESKEYMTIESDAPVRRVVSEPVQEPVHEHIDEPVVEKKPEQPRHSSGKAGRGKRRGRKV
ncbi:hypothetical protein FGF66_01480 [Chlorobaculum thiosulfatiphilum]|uniref:Uncharacterized protein n=1 Tax=Chlorobaculum thiosulfatiphilum TaxID=115852 RepID=A0A5C4S9Y6_CHLTI|nr:hypothetical protein [Chlorobaculum thiosulfatiphilum]TNJ39997.1 hypothetical protein FGF66_01480 [Chlorobaculum thiosulfatiphilum]